MEPVGLNLFFLAPVPLKINGDYRILEIKSDGSVLMLIPLIAAPLPGKVKADRPLASTPRKPIRAILSLSFSIPTPRTTPRTLSNLYLQVPHS